jgi:hypothetical protein
LDIPEQATHRASSINKDKSLDASLLLTEDEIIIWARVELLKHGDDLFEFFISNDFSFHISLDAFYALHGLLMLGFEVIACLHLCHMLHLDFLKPFLMKSPIRFFWIKTIQALNESVLISKQLVDIFERYKYFVRARGSLSSCATTDLNLL